MSARKLFTIAPHAKFLDTLVDRLLDGTLLGDWPRTGPFWLSDVTIVLPTRRAKLALADVFASRGIILLPDIRTFGGEVADEEPFLPPFEAPVLPHAISTLERRLVLSRLIGSWAHTDEGRDAFASPPNAAEILALAESLAGLIDDLANEGRTHADLAAIVPEDLAANWQQTLKFLSIVFEVWPHILASRNGADSTVLRNERLYRQANAAPLIFGDRPVIAAGSTGSLPATAALLQAIEKLPRGAVVLPALDTSITPAGHEALLREEDATHGHPQFGLAKLLRRLGAAISDVRELATVPQSLRTDLVRHSLALPDQTALWVEQRFDAATLDNATTGLSLLGARTEDEEARAIAIAARDALTRGQTVGIVTPDRNLARRIAAELARFEIAVDDAAGSPLAQSPAGRLLRQILALCANGCTPVDLMALLRNRATTLAMTRPDLSRLADLIELGALRGQRPVGGIEGVRVLVRANVARDTKHVEHRLTPDEGAEILMLLDALEAALAPLLSLMTQSSIHASALAHALCEAHKAISAPAPHEPSTRPPGDDELHQWGDQLRALPGEGLAFPPRNLENVLFALMAGFTVRNRAARRDDIAIWGQLEARLLNPDLIILASLNEDKWPEPADPGPWLSRGMRIAAGLEPPERRIGLAAHDYEIALGNSEIIIAFSERLGTSPAIASRFVQRLEAFVGEDCAKLLRAKGAVWLEMARSIDTVTQTTEAKRPAPNPDPAIRPKKLSVTEIETLFRSPYDLYAKHVLKLRPLDPLGEEPGARERGTIIHDIFARFVIEQQDFNAPDALAILNAMAVEAFAGLDAIGERRDIWLARFGTAAQLFLDFERERDPFVEKRYAEIDGSWTMHLAQTFELTGRADRVDLMKDGRLQIIDFKTGALPSPKDMRAFDAPQLLLEAAMARAGALKAIAPASSAALTYIKIGLGPEAFEVKEFKLANGFDLDSAADEASRRMQRHVDAFLFNATPMAARIRPPVNQRFAGAYEHLARTAEWTLTDGDDSQ